MTATESKVCCMVCRKAVATVIVKDNGLRVYPACGVCVSLYPIRPTIIRKC